MQGAAIALELASINHSTQCLPDAPIAAPPTDSARSRLLRLSLQQNHLASFAPAALHHFDCYLLGAPKLASPGHAVDALTSCIDIYVIYLYGFVCMYVMMALAGPNNAMAVVMGHIYMDMLYVS